MCDVKPGDRVVRIANDWIYDRDDPEFPSACNIPVGTEATVADFWDDGEGGCLLLVEHPLPENWAFYPPDFRKVQRRDLTAWLATVVKMPALDKRKVNA